MTVCLNWKGIENDLGYYYRWKSGKVDVRKDPFNVLRALEVNFEY